MAPSHSPDSMHDVRTPRLGYDTSLRYDTSDVAPRSCESGRFMEVGAMGEKTKPKRETRKPKKAAAPKI